ncbi:MAG TPA: ECF transporter S component [Erysipelothrix sp.]
MKKNDTRQLVEIAFLIAISVVLYMVEFPIIPGTPLQIDFSDLPVIVAAYTLGFIPAVFVALFKNILHIFFVTRNAGIAGEIANFAYALFIALPVIYFKKQKKYRYLVYTVVFAAIAMHFFNAWVTFPLYGMPSEGKHQMLITMFLPFNLVKGALLYLIFALIRPYLDRLRP